MMILKQLLNKVRFFSFIAIFFLWMMKLIWSKWIDGKIAGALELLAWVAFILGVVIVVGVNYLDFNSYQITGLIFALFALMAVMFALISELLEGDKGGIDTKEWWAGFMQGISTEMVGAIITGILFVFVVGAVEDRQAEEQWKKELILQMGSPDNTTAIEAARILSFNTWLRDGSLKGTSLYEANLEGANLIGANLEGANLIYINLRSATVHYANLQEANLEGANLRWVGLMDANLQSANIWYADLGWAKLEGANLQEANLRNTDLGWARLMDANLQGTDLLGVNLLAANLSGASFDTNTVLPDGTNWTTETDMSRFTDHKNPDFWRSEEPVSPAYRGDDSEE
jgi:hypothetical protein